MGNLSLLMWWNWIWSPHLICSSLIPKIIISYSLKKNDINFFIYTDISLTPLCSHAYKNIFFTMRWLVCGRFLKLVTICILFNIDTHRGCTGPSRSSDVIDKIRIGTSNKVTYKDYLDRVSSKLYLFRLYFELK